MRLVLTTRAGKRIPISYNAAPVRDDRGQTTGAVVVFHDQSEQRRAEQALRSADQRKDEFLATLAHELRNPLAPICMGLELLQMPPHDIDEARELYAMMSRQSQHMVRLIDDLMDVSRITRGKLELRRAAVQLADVIQNAVEATRRLVDEARLQLSVQLPGYPVFLYADAHRLTQVFSNLLNNAAKFTPPGGSIAVSADAVAGDLMVTIADTGVGIPEDKQESVFEMFSQVKTAGETMPAGLGLGLTLVRRLVEMHGGTVNVESAGHDQGSKFTVRLPIMQSPPPARSNSTDGRLERLRAPGRRILVVDDNPDALDSLSRILQVMGNDTLSARDGLEALQSAREFRPEVILMDLGMPNLDGYDAARRIRQEPWGRDVLMIATTGWAQDDDRRRSNEAGFDHHLVKPVDLTQLQSLISEPF
jgi:signal transduction histidine kinase